MSGLVVNCNGIVDGLDYQSVPNVQPLIRRLQTELIPVVRQALIAMCDPVEASNRIGNNDGVGSRRGDVICRHSGRLDCPGNLRLRGIHVQTWPKLERTRVGVLAGAAADIAVVPSKCSLRGRNCGPLAF